MGTLLRFGVDNDLAGLADTDAFSSNLRVVSEGEVDDTSFVGGHRFQGEGGSPHFHLLRHAIGESL